MKGDPGAALGCDRGRPSEEVTVRREELSPSWEPSEAGHSRPCVGLGCTGPTWDSGLSGQNTLSARGVPQTGHIAPAPMLGDMEDNHCTSHPCLPGPAPALHSGFSLPTARTLQNPPFSESGGRASVLSLPRDCRAAPLSQVCAPESGLFPNPSLRVPTIRGRPRPDVTSFLHEVLSLGPQSTGVLVVGRVTPPSPSPEGWVVLGAR